MRTTICFVILLTTFSATAQKETEKAPVKSNPIVAYGESISLASAKKALSAAEAFAQSNQWTVVIAIVDAGGNLVALEKLDNTQIGSVDIAIGKAKTANNFKRPTKVFEDLVANGGVGLRVLGVPGIVPLEGGEPIFSNGKIIGAIGVSGMQPSQDAEVARAGLSALK